MALINDPNISSAVGGTSLTPYAIDREWCLGDSLFFINRNFSNTDTRISSLSSNKFDKTGGTISGNTIFLSNVGIGTTSPNASLAIGNTMGGSALSPTLVTNAGSLGTTSGNALRLANFGFTSNNNTSLGLKARRQNNGTDWSTTAIGLLYDVDNTSPVNNSQIWLTAGGNVGIGQTSPAATLHVGASGAGDIIAEGDVIAFYSDERLKDITGTISNALEKINYLEGIYFKENKKAKEFGYNNKQQQVGVKAQSVQKVLPEAVTLAPFDTTLNEEGKQVSKSGENYLTVKYDKLVPLLIEAIKELSQEVKELKSKIKE